MPAKSTRLFHRNLSAKPKAPSGSPIWPNPAGYWCKKVKGRVVYFGAWRRRVNGQYQTLPDNGGYKDALNRYEAEIQGIRKNISVGRKPRTGPTGSDNNGGLTVGELCHRVLNVMLQKAMDDRRSRRTYADYRDISQVLVRVFGKDRLVESLELPAGCFQLYGWQRCLCREAALVQHLGRT